MIQTLVTCNLSPPPQKILKFFPFCFWDINSFDIHTHVNEAWPFATQFTAAKSQRAEGWDTSPNGEIPVFDDSATWPECPNKDWCGAFILQPQEKQPRCWPRNKSRDNIFKPSRYISSSGDYFMISRRFAHLLKWASSGQCFLTTYNMQLTHNNLQTNLFLFRCGASRTTSGCRKPSDISIPLQATPNCTNDRFLINNRICTLSKVLRWSSNDSLKINLQVSKHRFSQFCWEHTNTFADCIRWFTKVLCATCKVDYGSHRVKKDMSKHSLSFHNDDTAESVSNVFNRKSI